MAEKAYEWDENKRQKIIDERGLDIVRGLRLCVCFTFREDVVRLITIYKVNKKDWEKFYGKDY